MAGHCTGWSPFLSGTFAKDLPNTLPVVRFNRIWVHQEKRLLRVDVHRSSLGAGGIGSLPVDREATHVAIKLTLVTKTP